MKKNVLLLCTVILSLTVYAQEKIGSYTMSFFDGKTYEILASEPENDKFNLYIEVSGKYKSDDVVLCIESKNLESFKEALTQVRDKFSEWEKTAIENNVKDVSKDFPITFPKIDIAWYGSQWWFAYNQRIKPSFRVFKDGTCAMVVYTEATAASNEYIDQEVYWVLQKESEFNNVIRLLDKNIVHKHFKAKEAKANMFQ